jgi:hypothetical protein
LRNTSAVKSALRGHFWEKEEKPYNTGDLKSSSLHMKFSMTGEKKCDLKYRQLRNRGECMDRFDCIINMLLLLI